MLVRMKRWRPRRGWWLSALVLASSFTVLVWASVRLQEDPLLVSSIVRASHEVYTLDWDRGASMVAARRF